MVTVSEQVTDGNGHSPLAVELARLRAENAQLLRLLNLTRQEAAPPGPRQSGLFEAPPGLVHADSPPEAKVALFGALFAARTDVYAVRGENTRTGKAGWLPAVRGGWRKSVTPGRTPSSTSVSFSQRCKQDSEIPKSLAICDSGASPFRATATTSRRNSMGNALGMMNILPARSKSSQARSQPGWGQSHLTSYAGRAPASWPASRRQSTDRPRWRRLVLPKMACKVTLLAGSITQPQSLSNVCSMTSVSAGWM